MLHASSSSPLGFDQFSTKLCQKPVKNDLLDNSPAWIVDIALQALQQAGVEPVEWGSLLYNRMRVPTTVKDYFYLVPDEALASASDILSGLGLPLWPPSRLLTQSEGDFSAKGVYHRISRSTLPSSISSIALFPLSFSTLLPSELESKPPHHIQPSTRCLSILVPRPPAVYASLVRMMVKYPRYCSTRTVLASDLSELVGYNLLDLQRGYVDPEDEELWKELDVDGRIQRAITLVRQWGWDEEWREGEGWIGDALAGIIDGTADISHLPSSS
ncbi:hypothetical protein P691DRAFT_680326 [Macrolepiota fuliginosa MF-IS2]|uniref:Uncharacterized protein n=1 Tax=Macrolepiota fuliginosa MF-IS2 TaxID=1400762 RepID=A0A9P6BZ05_9AGAR|nr:hypothetical protein P691DRAFT_680326 [Macrolepiota fuliginosa MF-IS2]